MFKKNPLILVITFLFAGMLYADPAQLYEKGKKFQSKDQWYDAIEMYQAALKENPSYNLVYQGLAECFYELDEYDQALDFVKKARSYKQNEPVIENLYGFILIGLGKLDDAKDIFSQILKTYPNDPQACFGLAEIETASGRLALASGFYEEALKRQPENRKALLSLAVLSYEENNIVQTASFIKKALRYHGDSPQVHYFAAYLKALSGKDLEEAEAHLHAALKLKPAYDEADSLLSSILYAQKRYQEVIKISDKRISAMRNKADAWFIKALSLLKLDKKQEAMHCAKIALSIEPENEMIRALLEEIAIDIFNLEDRFRKDLAVYHVQRGNGFLNRNMTEQALYEYRRALKVYPYDSESREAYARLLLRKGYPERYLEQMEFIQTIVKSNVRVNDSVESYRKLLSTSLIHKWKLDPLYIEKGHISVGLFFDSGNASVLHPEAERLILGLASDIFAYSRRFKINTHGEQSTDYTKAFKTARTAGYDYFGIIRMNENSKDIHLTLELYVARTGSAAKTFNVYRSGNDRYVNALRRLTDMFTDSMPVIGTVVERYQQEAIIDIGKHDGNFENKKFEVLKKEKLSIAKDGIGLVYEPSDVLGFFEPTKIEEELSEGILRRNGYYDRIAKDDIVVLAEIKEEEKQLTDAPPDFQEHSVLFYLLRRIR